MRITPDLIVRSREFVNCLKERQLDLRGNKIPYIENLGATNDQVDTIDLCDNEIKTLANFPFFKRLSTVILSNNHISSIDPSIHSNLPNLHTLILNNNRVSLLSDVDSLEGLAKLESLSLVDNPVSHRNHYRLYVIHKLPSLKVLDFQKVKLAERQQASALFKSDAGKKIIKGVADPSAARKPSPEQLAKIQKAIALATSPEQVDQLEKMLEAGIVPDDALLEKMMKGKSQPDAAPAAESAPVAEPKSAPVAEPKSAPVAEPKSAPVAEPKSAPVAEPKSAPVSEPKSAPVAAPKPNPPHAVETTPSAPPTKPDGAAESETQPDTKEDDSMDVDDTPNAPVDVSFVDKLKVVELKVELQKYDLSTKGLKKDLAKRLKQHLLNN